MEKTLVGVGLACDLYNPDIHFLKSVIVAAWVRGRRIWRGMRGRQSINFHRFHFQLFGAIWCGVKLAKEQITICCQRPGLAAAKERKKKKWNTQENKNTELILLISSTEHIVISCWQRREMWEVQKRRWWRESPVHHQWDNCQRWQDINQLHTSTYTWGEVCLQTAYRTALYFHCQPLWWLFYLQAVAWSTSKWKNGFLRR